MEYTLRNSAYFYLRHSLGKSAMVAVGNFKKYQIITTTWCLAHVVAAINILDFEAFETIISSGH